MKKNLDKVIGKRIYLEALEHKSFSKDYEVWMRDAEVLRFLTGRTKAYTLQELEEYILKMNESSTNYLFGVFLKEQKLHIGNIKIGSIDGMHKFADVGLLIGNKGMWGRGYASEAIDLIVDYAFNNLGLNKLTAGMVVENIGSYKAFLKAGFREVGTLSRHVLLHGEYVDTRLLEKLKDA